MDKLKSLGEKALNKGGNKEQGGSSGGGGIAGTVATGGKGQDSGDKAFAAGEERFGIKPNAARDEMITDKGRDFIEKQTGKDIPDKFSN